MVLAIVQQFAFGVKSQMAVVHITFDQFGAFAADVYHR